ncbi:hypothetical protein PA598K_04136 [Paenibacillus sp. 598K]|uniref:DUF6786 family protein n=1 Tax=Paenibacillus sp. 598K TaxID=1117987 RepID=UPI000FFA4EC4|nr:DUF6786 family protein [Paenibacillus sp. 598K]GBF75709.1 hypothetical protein PA598K_04136 [Paenibacillus sp. 598K]
MKRMELIACLEDLGWRHRALALDGDGWLVALERGGRVIGLYPDPDGPNMLWTHPALSDRAAARRRFVEEQGWNLGGERVWLGPELEYCVVSAGEQVEYVVQRSIDPGAYRLSGTEPSATWQQEGEARLYRSEETARFRLTRTVRPSADPLRLCRARLGSAYSYVGYASEIELSAVGAERELPLSSWSIVQVPAGGCAYASTYGRARPTDLFAPTGPERLSVDDGSIRFVLDGQSAHKLSLRSSQTTGRFGYCRADEGGLYSLIVRQAFIDPSSDYLDTPWLAPDDRGHCVQLYNDDGRLGAFGELEHHAPAARREAATGLYTSRDRSQLWCYSGTRRAISDIGRELLGVELLY